MGGRGAGLGVGPSVGGQTEHWYKGSDEARKAMKAAGATLDERKAVNDFTGSHYYAIRKTQRNGNPSLEALQVESYIAKMPNWTGSELMRGTGSHTIPVDSLQVGTVVSMGGTSSWTTRTQVAINFARRQKDEGHPPIIWHLDGHSKRSAGVRHLSQFSSEDEVLISTKSQFKIKKVSTATLSNGILVYHVRVKEI